MQNSSCGEVADLGEIRVLLLDLTLHRSRARFSSSRMIAKALSCSDLFSDLACSNAA